MSQTIQGPAYPSWEKPLATPGETLRVSDVRYLCWLAQRGSAYYLERPADLDDLQAAQARRTLLKLGLISGEARATYSPTARGLKVVSGS